MEQSEQVLARAYASMRLTQLDEHAPALSLGSAGVGPVRLDHLRLRVRVELDVTPPGTLWFGLLHGGRVENRSGRSVRVHGPGDVFLTELPTQAYAATLHDIACDIAVIPPSLVAEVADGPPGCGAVRFTGHDPVSVAAGQRFRSTFGFVREQARLCGTQVMPSLMAAQASRLLAATALTTFPSTALTAPTPADRSDAHGRTLRRAVSFIEERADQDLSLADIARAGAVTIRTVQLAFRRHLDTTPTAYLRDVRLQRARDELLAADPDGTTVAAVAARWGFANASRFASRYRARFGELPSQTLHRQ